MVHALDEIRRVLVPNGLMIDLRPLSGQWPVEVFSARETRLTGHMTDISAWMEDDIAANLAMTDGENRGWFLREHEDFFPMNYVWDTPSEMEEWIKTEWDTNANLDEEVKRATRSAWAVGDADSRVRVPVKMVITRWRKL